MSIHLQTIVGGCADRTVLSLVHAKGRVDISSRSLIDISVQTHTTFLLDNRQTYTTNYLHVLIEVDASVGARIGALTYQIIGDPVSIVVDGRVVTSPIVRDALCGPISITCYEMAEAEELASQLRAAWRRPVLRVVS
jgi:preprotein translocase subunit SecD